MPKLDLVRAQQIKGAAGEVLQLKGPGFTWSRPKQIEDFYGVGPGDVTLRLKSSEAVLDGSFVQRVPNAGGLGAAFDLITTTATIQLSEDGALVFDPADWMRFSGVAAASAPDIMGASFVIVLDATLGADQYILGNGSPQSNVWLTANGSQIRFNRRNPVSNSFETVIVGLSPAVNSGLWICHIEMVPGTPGGPNGGTTGGVIKISVNGELRGSASHPYPEFRTWNYAAGQNIGSATGLNADVYDTLLIARGGDHDLRMPVILDRLADLYGGGV